MLKKNKPYFPFTKSLLFFLFLSFAFVSETLSRSVESLIKTSPYEAYDKFFVKEALESFPIEPLDLKKARLLYLDENLLREMGVEGSSAQLEKEALKAFSWIASETKTPYKAYADFYGGGGMGNNIGSGRAGILGEVQIKGIGITPAFKDHGDRSIEEGVLSLREALREAIWGLVFYKELPFRAHRVIALIDTGLFTLEGERKVLAVRKTPLRPAHFLSPYYSDKKKHKKRALKMENQNFHKIFSPFELTQSALLKKFQEKKIPLTEKQKHILLTLDQIMYRVARQVSRTYAHKLYHGAYSESNISVRGEFLDFEIATSNSGYGRITTLSHVKPFGADFNQIKEVWGADFLKSLKLKKHFQKKLFLFSYHLDHVWDFYLNESLRAEMLSLTGIPEFVLYQMKNEKVYQKLGDLLFKVSQKANRKKTVMLNVHHIPKMSGAFDFSKLLLSLIKSSENIQERKKVLRNKNLEENTKKELLTLWKEFYEKASFLFYENYGEYGEKKGQRQQKRISFSSLISKKALFFSQKRIYL